MSHQVKRFAWLKRVGFILSLMLLVIVTGVFVVAATAGGSASCTLNSGRSVTTNSDSWYLESQSSGDTATINTSGFQIVVAPQELRVDGKAIQTIENGVKKVTVNVQDRRIIFLADGKSVANYPR
ncbi:hypothetical protein [uncultured Gimesia sp.]|uniref:hypothetical protein n=1 Tax=uncultured Gimesia sp. TaxID=1678688 RepID=UPI000E9BF794|nr:hypothetical protein [Planctomycetaceae bacterium]HBL45966.1 hypothetical protein [Planctomycetaceae bacterium]|tara:strand:- start:3763 stop:4137 length:375 start_codon:yes stop_codon:yes gene_type:complete